MSSLLFFRCVFNLLIQVELNYLNERYVHIIHMGSMKGKASKRIGGNEMKMEHTTKSYIRYVVLTAIMLMAIILQTGMVRAELCVTKDNDPQWKISKEEDGTVSIAPANPSTLKGEVIIPEKVNGYTVNHIARNAFASLEAVVEITVPDSVTVIEENAFANCSKLKKVTLSKNITTVSSGLFMGCEQLMYADIPEGVTVIGDRAYEGCAKLKEMEIPYGVACIGEQAFDGCKRLKNIKLPRSVKSVGSRAFAYCGLKTAVIPREVTDIQEDIFFGDHTLRDIYYLGTRMQWNELGCRNLAEPGFTYKDHAGYHIVVHFFASVTLTDPVSATYQVNDSNVVPLSVSVEVNQDEGQSIENISYQWYEIKEANKETGNLIKQATSNEYIPSVKEPGQMYYYCVTTIMYDEGQASYTSAIATITVLPNKEENSMTGGTGEEEYEVTFIGNEDFSVPSQKVKGNDFVEKPVLEIEDEYVKVVWYQEKDFLTSYDFAQPVTKNFTLYGREELDYTLLQIVVNQARTQLADMPYISRYTPQSVQRYNAVVDVAQEMLKRRSASSKQDLIQMIHSVRDAKKMLIIKPEERPVPVLKHGDVTVRLHNEQLNIHQYKKGVAFEKAGFEGLYEEKDIQEVREIHLEKAGFYTIYVTDPFQDDYYLVVYYDKDLNDISFLDLSMLADEITKAQILCDTTPVGKEHLSAGAGYTDLSAKNNYQNAISKAEEQFTEIKTMQDAEELLKTLHKSESEFRESFCYVDWVTVDVNGSTVRVIPMETYSLSVVQYNIDAEGNITQGLWNNWSDFASKPYTQKNSDFVWNNVPDGIYTFIITMKDQAGGTVWGIKRFVVANNASKEDVMKDYMKMLIAQAKETLASVSKASEVTDGELCVPDGIYNYLKSGIEDAENLLVNPHRTYDWMMNDSFKLTAGRRDAELNKEAKVSVSHEIEINEDNGKITVSGSGLFKCSYTKGTFHTDETYIQAGYRSFSLLEGAGEFQVNSNGIYTIRCLYRDDVVVFKSVEVTDILKGAEVDGKIKLTYAGEQEIVSTKYAYDDGSENKKYRTYVGLKEELIELGNGTYDVIVKYANGEEDILQVQATACTEPVILQEGNTITVYDYGFTLKTAMYAKGHFEEWEEMFNHVFNVVEENTPVDTSAFNKGEYTFYFQDENGKEYWKYITIE